MALAVGSPRRCECSQRIQTCAHRARHLAFWGLTLKVCFLPIFLVNLFVVGMTGRQLFFQPRGVSARISPNEQITPITTIKRHRAAAGRVRHRPRSLKTAGIEVRSSSRTSTYTRNPDQHPVTHTQLGRAAQPSTCTDMRGGHNRTNASQKILFKTHIRTRKERQTHEKERCPRIIARVRLTSKPRLHT